MKVAAQFSFTAKLFEWDGPQSWFFVTLPKDQADFIEENFGHNARGFKSLRVEVTIDSTTWKTSIFPDSKRGTYLLPVKAEIRKKVKIDAGDKVKVSLTILI